MSAWEPARAQEWLEVSVILNNVAMWINLINIKKQVLLPNLNGLINFLITY